MKKLVLVMMVLTMISTVALSAHCGSCGPKETGKKAEKHVCTEKCDHHKEAKHEMKCDHPKGEPCTDKCKIEAMMKDCKEKGMNEKCDYDKMMKELKCDHPKSESCTDKCRLDKMKKICKEKGMMEEHKCDHPKGEPCTDLCKYETKEDCKPKAEKKDCHKK